MQSRLAANCSVILAFGLLACCFFATLWPHEPTAARTSYPQNNIELVTVPVQSLTSMAPDNDAVFALDCVSGQLQGAKISGRTATFTDFYYRNVAADFDIDPAKGTPHYAIVTGISKLPAKGRIAWNYGVLYVGELSSGKIHTYAFPLNDVRGKQPPVQLQLIDAFPFRQPMQK